MTLVSLSTGIACAQTIQELTTAEQFKSRGGTLLYRQHITPDIPKGKRVPLVLFLHGMGERGDDNISQTKHGVLPLIKYADANGGAVIIAPQCPKDDFWKRNNENGGSQARPNDPSAIMLRVLALIEEKKKTLPVDPNRIYITGLSMGGHGTWDVIQRRPSVFAAAIPICGGGDPTKASAIKNIPIWIFHGDADATVAVTYSREMEAALKKYKGNVRYTEYPKVEHDSWTRTYADTEVLDWLFSQKRSQR